MTAPKVKVSVVQKLVMDELTDQYHVGYPEGADRSCNRFQVGDEFIFQVGAPNPVETQGFCPWAYCDLQRDIEVMKSGGSQPWMKDKDTFIACCTDGLRPVFFKLERLPEETEQAVD